MGRIIEKVCDMCKKANESIAHALVESANVNMHQKVWNIAFPIIQILNRAQ